MTTSYDRSSVLALLLYVFGLAAGTQCIGVIAYPTDAVLMMIAFVLAGIVRRDLGRLSWLGAVLALVGLASIPTLPESRIAAAMLWFYGLSHRQESPRDSLHRALGLSCVLLLVFQVARGWSPLLWHGQESAARIASALASTFARVPVDVGPSYIGFGLLGLGVFVLVGLWSRSDERSVRPLLFALTSMAILWLVYLWLLARVPLKVGEFELTREAPFWHFIGSHVYPHYAPLILLGALLFPLAWFAKSLDTSHPRPVTRSRYGLVGIAALAVAAILLQSSRANAEAGGRIAIYEKGFVNWIKPSHGYYGPGSVGMMGLLPDYLTRGGYQPEKISELSKAALDDKDVLVVVNQTELFRDDELRAVRDFVRGGKSLLVLGDHTAWKQDMVLPNQLLADTAIRFNFDNAEFFVGGWLHSYDFWPHQIVAGLERDENSAGSVIGASLDIRYPAVPLVVGRHGFSDPGDTTQQHRAFMGNRKFDVGERLGDLVLAAVQEVGDGRVMVVGDTSAFSNGVMTIAWPFVMQAFEWLAGRGGSSASLPREVAALLLLVLAAVITFRSWRGDGVQVGLVVAVGAAIAMLRPSPSATHFPQQPAGSLPLAVIENAHAPQCSREGVMEEGLSSFTIHLMRDGLLPVHCNEFSSAMIDNAQLVISIAPTDRYREDEVTKLVDFVRAGGRMILSVGMEEEAAAHPLLEAFGFQLEACPLGMTKGEVEPGHGSPSFISAWPVVGSGEVLARIWGRSVACMRDVGRGRVAVIGDSRFLRDVNLETKQGVARGNIDFLRNLIGRLLES
ncbi:MAG: hypothetical protein H6832_16615 [Planctomycetes bacterium]|nr:hypothetical protein [Planctomycetota bacterium]MCB9920027.1 hypothetical protein [Planctomycetota bacterium]